MSKTNRGKQFEKVIYEAFKKVLNISIDRIPDQQSGYIGSKNICDFQIYKYPYQLYIECKTVYGNTLPLSRITDTQFNGLMNKNKIEGVCAGVIVWWVDKDITKFIPIDSINTLHSWGEKSIKYYDNRINTLSIKGTKKRVFFDYDMEKFIQDVRGYLDE